MKTVKRVLCERGLRRIPAQFSWVATSAWCSRGTWRSVRR